MLGRFLRAQREPSATTAHTLGQLRDDLANLERRLSAVEHFTNLLHDRELTRAAEHHAMLDRLDRLYKRVSQRLAYDESVGDRSAAEKDSESVTSLKKRLGR